MEIYGFLRPRSHVDLANGERLPTGPHHGSKQQCRAMIVVIMKSALRKLNRYCLTLARWFFVR